MEHPRHDVLEIKQRMTPERVVGLVFVGLLHAAIIYALASGLAQRFVKELPHVITAQVIQPQPQPQNIPPPPQPQFKAPPEPAVPPPVITIQSPAPAPITVVKNPNPPAPAPPAPAPISTAVRGILSTHTIPPYPEVARRMGEEGTTTVKIDIDAAGQITDVSLISSSGSSLLDNAAINWVKQHWKYKAAVEAGKPVPSTTEAAIKFDLKNASSGFGGLG